MVCRGEVPSVKVPLLILQLLCGIGCQTNSEKVIFSEGYSIDWLFAGGLRMRVPNEITCVPKLQKKDQ